LIGFAFYVAVLIALIAVASQISKSVFGFEGLGAVQGSVLAILAVMMLSFALFNVDIGDKVGTIIPSWEDFDFAVIFSMDILANLRSDVTDWYERQVMLATGDIYTAEVDQSHERDVGVTVQYQPSSDAFIEAEQATIIGIVKGTYLDPAYCESTCQQEDPGCSACKIRFTCEPQNFEAETEVSPKELSFRESGGVIFGQAVTCSYKPEKVGTQIISLKATYDFITKSYMPLYMIAESEFKEVLNAKIRQTGFRGDIDAIKQEIIQKNGLPSPRAISSEGPVIIGLEGGVHETQPMIVSSEPGKETTIGFSIVNNAEGYINKIHSVKLILPMGITVKECFGASFDENEQYIQGEKEVEWNIIPKATKIKDFSTTVCKISLDKFDLLLRGPGITQNRMKVTVYYEYVDKQDQVLRIRSGEII